MGFLIAKAGGISTQGVCHSFQKWSFWLRRTKKLGLVWCLPESDVPVLQGWEPLVLGARGP